MFAGCWLGCTCLADNVLGQAQSKTRFTARLHGMGKRD